MIKVNAISQQKMKDFHAAYSNARSLEEEIFERITYILEFLCKLEKSKLETWYFDEAAEGEVGNLVDNMDRDRIYNITLDGPGWEGNKYILKDGETWQYAESILTRWLYEDFENELIEGKEKFEIKQAADKEKKKKAVENKKVIKTQQAQLAELAKAKLSKEELAALKSVLTAAAE